MIARRDFIGMVTALAAARPASLPEKVVVLTFDDAVKSHRTFVAPLLKELGFRATFFVSHAWMPDQEHFMSWDDIGEIHAMGFEIGNHSWTHASFSSPRNAARLPAELYLVERMLERATPKVAKPVSFAYSGNRFGPEAVRRLSDLGYKLARRGMQPEVTYGKIEVGPAFDPQKHHPLLIPTTGDAYPGWTLEHFQRVVAQATPGKAAVLQFHGVPDLAHAWVHTPPARFREYMAYLKEGGFRVIALGDLAPYIDFENPPDDPMLKVRYTPPADGKLLLPVEMEATRSDARYWLENMIADHRFSIAEAAGVGGWSEAQTQAKIQEFGTHTTARRSGPRVLPYPGGRQVRMGFFANICAFRGTKASVFLPWDPASYVVVDLPEAIFTGGKLLYLTHTDIPTMWDEQNIVLDNIDWTREARGGLSLRRVLPNQVAFGASIHPDGDAFAMDLWLENKSPDVLTGLRTQVCVMLKGAPDFNSQTTGNKVFRCPSSVVRSAAGDRWIGTTWQRCGRAWGHPLVPCLHADPVFADCQPGETVRVAGKLWFYQGAEIETEIRRRNEIA